MSHFFHFFLVAAGAQSKIWIQVSCKDNERNFQIPLVCHVCERKTSNFLTLEWPAKAANVKVEAGGNVTTAEKTGIVALADAFFGKSSKEV